MKKILTMALAAALLCTAPLTLAACGQGGGTDEGTSAETLTGQFATMADILTADTSSMASTCDGEHYVCAFELDGTWWRVEAELEEGMYDELMDVWVEDQAKVEELISPLAVTKAEELEPLDAESLEALAGKTGADLAADGFVFMEGAMVVNGEETDCVANLGDFDYLVTFEGAVADENATDVAGVVADMTVSSVSLQSVSFNAIMG